MELVVEAVTVLHPRDDREGPPAFDAFYDAEFRSVVGLVWVLSGSTEVAEETAQDAFMTAYREWPRISSYDSPEAWVRRVALNAALTKRRSRLREAAAVLRLGGRRQPVATLPEPAGRFWAAVRALPARQAQAVALHYLEDRPVTEIAGVLGCSEGTVKTHLSRGRAALAVALDETLEDG